MPLVYLGLGSNLGDRQTNLITALDELDRRACYVRLVSPFYETEPWGVVDQGRFLNAACSLDTNQEPLELLDLLKEIEKQMGRVVTLRNGPRPIDLDILLYGECVLRFPRLTIPHVGMLNRSSVLVPLCDLCPSRLHPLTRQTMISHLAALGPTPEVAPYPPGL